MIDTTLIVLAVAAPYALAPALESSAGRPLTDATVAVTWVFALAALRTRDASLFGAGPGEYRRVLHATGAAFGTLAVLAVLLQLSGMRAQILLTLPLGTLALLLGRWLSRRWLVRQRQFGHFVSRTIVLGDRSDVEYVLDTLERTGQLGYLVVGTALTDSSSAPIVVRGRRYPVLGTIASAATAAAQLSADTIIVASQPHDDPDFVKRLGWQLEGTAAQLVLSSRLTDVAGPRISLLPVDGLPLIQVKIPTFDGAQYALKRALDVVVSALALLVIAIISVPIAIAIAVDSRGPVFFRQERVGRDGRTFMMLKFRTMRVGSEAELQALVAQNEGAGPLFKLREDPRVTRVGRFLRRLSLDELPQFWNVLVGDMSIVGPRPPLIREVDAYEAAVHRRLFIKPGITGPWQIGGRSDLSWDESVRLDLRYVENWSIVNDVIIMWRTARMMVSPQAQGAY
nr:sugar transferase [Microbacterium gorillae]